MFRSRRARVCAFLVLTMTVFALPKLLLAHPGHNALTGLVADALLLSTGGCDDSANTEVE
ncbi:MAG: hypothetical protein DHS20C16_33050 [Phycisphaerae bacterium]|nr:MAG: hypothetical protein DHS20C16_33050 [Phycisphaerae bacterium]